MSNAECNDLHRAEGASLALQRASGIWRIREGDHLPRGGEMAERRHRDDQEDVKDQLRGVGKSPCLLMIGLLRFTMSMTFLGQI